MSVNSVGKQHSSRRPSGGGTRRPKSLPLKIFFRPTERGEERWVDTGLSRYTQCFPRLSGEWGRKGRGQQRGVQARTPKSVPPNNLFRSSGGPRAGWAFGASSSLTAGKGLSPTPRWVRVDHSSGGSWDLRHFGGDEHDQ